MAKAILEASVKNLGDIYEVKAPWDESLKALRNKRANPINARGLAYARIQEGRNSSLYQYGSYTQEGLIYVPKSDILLVRKSPLLNKISSEKATQAHREGKEFYLDAGKYQKQAEQDKNKDPQKRKVFTLNKKENFEIPTNRFKDEELSLWLFGDQAEAYGNFLKENNINEMPVWLVSQDHVNNQKQSFARQLWLHYLVIRSDLSGDYRTLNYVNRTRGVQKTSEAGSQPKLPYTQREVSKALKLAEEVRVGKLGNSKLEKVVSFLENLKE